MAKDLIVGVVDGYDWDKIKYWANSIKASGFDGYKTIIAYNMDKATIDKLTEEEFMIVGCTVLDDEKGFIYDTSRGSIMVDRFMHIYQMLDQFHASADIGRVIATDVKDVVFQSDPSEWLDKHISKGVKMVVGSENMLYKDEPWGRNNMTKSFGDFFLEKMGDEPINCAGVLAGNINTFKDFCLNLWLVCRGLNPHVPGGGGPDQAAMNIMLQMESYKDNTFFLSPEMGWVLHAGTSLPAIKAGSGGIGEAYVRNPNIALPFINDITVEMKDDNVCVNGNKMCIVHQWDRVPEWKETITKKFGE